MLGRTTKCDFIEIQPGLQPAFVLLVFDGFTSRGGGSRKFVDPSHDRNFQAVDLTKGQNPQLLPMMEIDAAPYAPSKEC